MSELVENRIVLAEVHKHRSYRLKFVTVICYGKGRARIKAFRNFDMVSIEGGCDSEISGYRGIIKVTPTFEQLVFREEVLSESGKKILHITGE